MHFSFLGARQADRRAGRIHHRAWAMEGTCPHMRCHDFGTVFGLVPKYSWRIRCGCARKRLTATRISTSSMDWTLRSPAGLVGVAPMHGLLPLLLLLRQKGEDLSQSHGLDSNWSERPGWIPDDTRSGPYRVSNGMVGCTRMPGRHPGSPSAAGVAIRTALRCGPLPLRPMLSCCFGSAD